MKKHLIILGLGLMYTFLINISSVFGQGNIGSRLNYLEVAEQTEALQLNIFFNLVDQNNSVLSDYDVVNANFLLDGLFPYEGKVIQPNLPFYITLVLDTSGSMINSNNLMREAASSAVQSAPNLAEFAIITFDDQVQTRQNFTADRNLTLSSIQNIQSVQGGGTCLYDAINSAVDLSFNKEGDRHAIILFTDGIDENRNGTGGCSNVPLDVPLQRLRSYNNGLPVYVVGMLGGGDNAQLNQLELKFIADATGGDATFGDSSEVGSMFNHMMRILSNQWLAQVLLYPTQGGHEIELTPILDNDIRSLPLKVAFQSTRTYDVPFELFVSSFTQQNQEFILGLKANGAGRMTRLEVRIHDEDNFDIGLPQIYNTIPSELHFPLGSFPKKGKYTIVIMAYGIGDIQLLQEPVEYVFSYSPDETLVPDVLVNITDFVVNPDNEGTMAQITGIGRDQVHYYTWSVVEQQSGSTVNGPNRTDDAFITSIAIDFNQLSWGEDYKFCITAYNENNEPFTEQACREFSTPPRDILLQAEDIQSSRDSIRLRLFTQNIDVVDSLRIIVVDENQTSVNVNNEPLVVLGVPDLIEIPIIPRIGVYEYVIQIRMFDVNGQVIFDEPYTTKRFTYANELTFQEHVFNFITNPLIITSFVVVVLLLIALIIRERLGGRISHRKESLLPYSSSVSPSVVSSMEATIGRSRNRRMPTPTPRPIDKIKPQLQHGIAPLIKLEIRDSNKNNLTSKTFRQDRCLIGRLKDCDLTIDNPYVSREHLIIQYDSKRGQFIVTDLESKQGTKLNGEKLRPQISYTIPSGQESVIQLGGKVEITFREL